jgi:ATP phosphoribosyltransferase-like protein
MQGVVNATESKYVMLNADASKVKEICKLLPGSESPTVIPLDPSQRSSQEKQVSSRRLRDCR